MAGPFLLVLPERGLAVAGAQCARSAFSPGRMREQTMRDVDDGRAPGPRQRFGENGFSAMTFGPSVRSAYQVRCARSPAGCVTPAGWPRWVVLSGVSFARQISAIRLTLGATPNPWLPTVLPHIETRKQVSP